MKQKGYRTTAQFFFGGGGGEGGVRVEILNVLYILEALMHNNIMTGRLPGWTTKDIEPLADFFFRLRVEMLNVLYILEALRHNNIMPGLLPGWTRKDIEKLPNFSFYTPVEILNVLYILEALRGNNIMPGLLPGWTRKDRTTACLILFCTLEALRHNYIPEYLRSSLRWARWDKCNYYIAESVFAMRLVNLRSVTCYMDQNF